MNDLIIHKGTILILLDRAYCFKSGSYRQLAFFLCMKLVWLSSLDRVHRSRRRQGMSMDSSDCKVNYFSAHIRNLSRVGKLVESLSC